jgi:hypothetical protein
MGTVRASLKAEPSPQAADLGHMKGAPVVEFLNWYAETVDRPRLLVVLRELEGAWPNRFDATRDTFGLLASAWYPAGLVHELIDRVVAGYDEPKQQELAQAAADFIMGRTLRGVYKVMFSMFATPERYARHISKLWAQHYDTGLPVVRIVAANEHHIRFDAWTSHHPFICAMNMSSARPIYRAMKCSDVTWRRVSCVSHGGDVCAAVVRWTARG